MAYVMRHCEPIAKEMNIKEFEREIGSVLPSEYRAHLLQYNGGIPRAGTFKYIAPDGYRNGDTIGRFYTIGLGDVDDISRQFKGRVYRDRALLPDELLEIAYTGVGNAVLIGIKGDPYGKIYFLDRPYFIDEDGIDPWAPIIKLADGFNQFMNEVLYVYPAEDA